MSVDYSNKIKGSFTRTRLVMDLIRHAATSTQGHIRVTESHIKFTFFFLSFIFTIPTVLYCFMLSLRFCPLFFLIDLLFRSKEAYLSYIGSCDKEKKYFTAWKVSVFGVFLVRIFPHFDWILRDTVFFLVILPSIKWVNLQLWKLGILHEAKFHEGQNKDLWANIVFFM